MSVAASKPLFCPLSASFPVRILPPRLAAAGAEIETLVPWAGRYFASRAANASLATWRSARRSDFSLAIARIPWIVTAKNLARASGVRAFDNSPLVCSSAIA